MALDIALFRQRFPEFADPTLYPDVTLNTFYDMACIFVEDDGCPWKTLTGKRLTLVLEYMTAHLLILSKQATAGGAGSAESNQGGFETSATIGEISVTKLAPPAKDAWDWWMYQTPYGQALMALLSVLAVGGLSIGGLDETSSFRRAGGVFW